jgi:hypothetical protein
MQHNHGGFRSQVEPKALAVVHPRPNPERTRLGPRMAMRALNVATRTKAQIDRIAGSGSPERSVGAARTSEQQAAWERIVTRYTRMANERRKDRDDVQSSEQPQ